jgi:hypothetical protein
MIDRNARNAVIAAFEDFLEDKITAFQFDDRLQDIESDDRTVNAVVHAAWYHYDDCKDHKVTLSKQEWDYFQRLLLILRSNTEIATSETTRRSWDHVVAWLSLALFIVAAFFVEWGIQLVLLAIPFGLISMLISRYRRQSFPEPSPNEIAYMPFDSYSQIRWLRRQAPSFQKRRYRSEIEGRRIRSKVEESFNSVFASFLWLILGPIVLLFQGFSSRDGHKLTLTTPNQ